MPAADTRKKQKLPKPAEKPKSASKKSPAPKKVVRSEEKVVGSSDEDDEGESLGETIVVAAAEKSSTEETSESESESEEKSEDGPAAKSSEKVYKYKYKPPPSFKIIPPSSSSHKPFSAKNLNGKELWFITAPYAAPLSKLDVINPADIAEGFPVLQTSSGRGYCLRAKDEREETEGIEVFVEDGKGGYQIAGKQIEKSFQMVESLPMAKVVTADMVPKNQPVREQPEGLQMRFKPIGFEGEMEQDGNVEVKDFDIEVRPPRKLIEDGEGEHRKKKHKSHKDGEKKKHRRKSKDSVGV